MTFNILFSDIYILKELFNFMLRSSEKPSYVNKEYVLKGTCFN